MPGEQFGGQIGRTYHESTPWWPEPAQVSPRHYDLVTRPLLIQLLASRLADRHRIDLAKEPGRARAVVGEDVWRWVDPGRPPDRSSQPPGVDRRTVTAIVERLERL